MPIMKAFNPQIMGIEAANDGYVGVLGSRLGCRFSGVEALGFGF